MYGANKEGFSQASVRSFRIFRDQHGRQWGADVENKTQHPCGPLAPRFRAPLVPPQKYLRITNAAAGEMVIDYHTWERDLLMAHEEYNLFALEQATAMFGDAGPEKLEKRDPALLRRVGPPPGHLEPVQAARAGNGWILGLKRPDGTAYPKPKAAEKYFPEPVKPTLSDPFAEDEAEDEATTYPLHKGGGYWYLDAGHQAGCEDGTAEPFKGKKEKAVEAAKAREPVATVAHESWGV